MSFDLHLRLTGLCALVPSEPLTTLPAPPAPQVPVPLPLPRTVSSLRVLLPDVHVERPIGGHKVCAHSPVLRVEQPDGSFQELAVLGDEIKILTIDESSPGVELQPTFSLVADLVRVRPDFQVDDALFANPIRRSDIACRLEIPAAKAFGLDPTPQVLSFPTTPLYAGNFAQGVRLEIRITGETGTFELTSFPGRTVEPRVRPISFGPKPDGTPVRAELKNLCNQVEMAPSDADFAAFYLLEAQLKEPFHVPKPFVPPGEILGGATNGGTCIPGRTNHHS